MRFYREISTDYERGDYYMDIYMGGEPVDCINTEGVPQSPKQVKQLMREWYEDNYRDYLENMC